MDAFYTLENLTRILDSLPLRIFWKDITGVFQGGNLAFCQDMGYASINDIIGKTDYDLSATQEYAQQFLADDQYVITTGKSKLGIIEKINDTHNPQGEQWVRTNKIPLYDNQKNIIGVIGIYEEITHSISLEKKQAYDTLQYQGTHDYLTGVLNRQSFEKELENSITRSQSFILAFIDLDNFKIINDTSGHKAGDEVLRLVAQLMLASLRKNDLVGRLGGDEFGILLPACSSINAISILNSICKVIDNFKFTRNNYNFHISASIGVLDGTEEKEVTEALNKADAACYVAKSLGGNRVLSYDKNLMELNVLKTAIANAEQKFSIFKQKIHYMAHSCEICQFTSCAFYAISFGYKENEKVLNKIEAIEHYQLSFSMDKWVVEQTIDWLIRQPEHTYVFITLSQQTVTNLKFIEFLKTIIHTINTRHVFFEISERHLIKMKEVVLEFIHQLKLLNFSIAVSNFGCGFLSFDVFKSQIIDVIKIDEKFFKNVQIDEVNQLILSSICLIAKKLNVFTLATSISKENERVLATLGVNFFQRENEEIFLNELDDEKAPVYDTSI